LKKSKKEIAEVRRELKNPTLRKLAPDQVVEIRGLLAKKMPHREIATRFGTNRGTVGDIGRGKTYTDIA
jgi:DNA invertase Pin-like site-specific DNA recombinase